MTRSSQVVVLWLVVVLLAAACGTPTTGRTALPTSQAGVTATLPPGGAAFRSDAYHLAATLPPGWAAAEGPASLARPFTGLVAFNSWGATNFWAPEVQTANGATYSPQSTLSQVPGGEAYVVLVQFSGGPVMEPEAYGPEHEPEDLARVWSLGDCREAGGATYAEFYKWGRLLRLEVYCQPDAAEATAAAVQDLLASWRFDRAPAGDPGWATVQARALLPAQVQPERFPLLSAWSVEGEPAVSSVQSGEVARLTRAEAAGEVLTITFTYRWDDPATGVSDEECPAERCHWWRFEARPSGEVVLVEEGGVPLPGGAESATPTLPATATALPTPYLSPEPSTTTATLAPASPTAARRTPAPSTTAPPAVTDLVPPLIVDSQSGRLYMTGQVDGVPQIVALAADDGHLLATYGITGTFAVDPVRGWLYVDQNKSGLLVLDAKTGEQKTLISLPRNQKWELTYPAPQADPAAGQVLAFRDHLVYVIDPDQGTVVRTIPFDVPKGDDCRDLTDPLPIEWTVYDDSHRLLYLDFLTYACIPWIGETIVSFDMNANAQIAQQGVDWATATAADGSLYGSSWYRMGVGFRWAWRGGRPWFESGGWNNSADLFVDAARGRLYESEPGYGFRAFDLATMSLLFVLPSPVDGDLVGYDPGTDQLYFLRAGRLAMYAGDAIVPPAPQAPQVADPPAKPVRQLVVSSARSPAPTLFGLWDYDLAYDNCYVFGVQGGLFYLSSDGGNSWAQPRGGLDGGCQRVSALAVSPEYATDRTILAALVGNGIFRSTDGGQLWRPASTGLRGMSVEELLLSPGVEGEQVAFAKASVQGQRRLFRSTDGGATWEELGAGPFLLAMSPDFDQDGILMGVSEGQVVVSRDRGETWQHVGSEPDGGWFHWLSLAPLFERWQVAFAFGGASQNLYRSVDGGHSWDVVLSLEGHVSLHFLPQLAYGPETERGRLLYLSADNSDPNADPPIVQGTLYRSEDGGVNWEALELPAGLVPTALAISPTYAQDGLLWLGTADGRVVAVEAAQLHGGP